MEQPLPPSEIADHAPKPRRRWLDWDRGKVYQVSPPSPRNLLEIPDAELASLPMALHCGYPPQDKYNSAGECEDLELIELCKQVALQTSLEFPSGPPKT